MDDLFPGARRTRRLAVAVAATVGLIVMLLPTVFEPAGAAEPTGVSFRLEGCRANSDTITNNICLDTHYSTGNLDSPGQGPSWNELDLVPHRLTSSAGNSAPNSQTFDATIAVDSQDAGKTGYDVLSAPVKNAAKSDASCSISVGPQQSAAGGSGGTDLSLTRLLTITQNKNTDCVFDFYARLAVGAHEFPGSSLHSNISAGTGDKDISIPVNQIQPQSISKTMNASRNANYIWTVQKGSTPTSLNFSNTCSSTASDREATVAVTVTWTKSAANPTGFTVVTSIYATNPANRTIRVEVDDAIRSGTTVLENKTDFAPVDLSAHTANILVATHTLNLAASAVADPTSPNFNDIATATYTDVLTGVPVPGTTTATASVANGDIASGTITNPTATVSDTESISGSGLTFAVATPATGSFSGYTAGTFVTGPVVWNSGTLSSSGSVTFNKTVRAAAGTSTSTGSLDDTATLTPSNSTAQTASLNIGVTSSAAASITISKTVTQKFNTSRVFTFRAKLGGVDQGTTTITIPADSLGPVSGTISGLAQNTAYTITEDATAPYPARTLPGTVTVTAPACSTTINVENDAAPATARVQKITDPTGSTVWSFTLTGPNSLSETKTATAGAGYVSFAADLDVDGGTYTITETTQAGWDNTNVVGDFGGTAARVTKSTSTHTCSFTLDALTDSGKILSCTFSNTQRGTISVHKTSSNGAPTGSESFLFDLRQGASTASNGTTVATGTANAGNGGDISFGSGALYVPGTYQICESIAVGWHSTIQDMVGAFVPGTGGDTQADNQYVCVPITLAAGQDYVLNVNNTPPPGGMAKTIGYWKNHASCKASSGNQAAVLDQWLAAGGAILVGDLSVSTCEVAVDLLNKSKVADPTIVGDGKKAASDPAFNLVAQLLAYDLNIRAGADSTCAAANTAAASGQTLLAALDFDGDGHLPINKANATLLNGYAATLDSYNNNTLCP